MAGADDDREWNVTGFTVLCNGGRCHREEVHLVLHADLRGIIRVDGMIRPINANQTLGEYFMGLLQRRFPGDTQEDDETG